MKFLKRSLLVLSLLFLGVLLASCDFPSGGNNNDDEPANPGEEQDLTDYKAYIKDDLNYVIKGFEDQVSAGVLAKCKRQVQLGLDAIDSAKTVKQVQSAYNTAKKAVADCIPLANGFYTYSGLSQAEKTDILGILESYAIRNGITGISLFENGNYVMYHERVTLGTEVYIVGYGFGLLAEGSLNADLEYEQNAAWKRYLHTWNINDPGTANYLNDQGSEVGDFYGYFGSAFYTTFMNETKDGYDWVPELAKEMPQPVGGLDENGQAKTYRFEVRVGAEAKYNTNSTIPSRAAFNGREVALEDYLTPFKLLLTQSNGLYRGSELANTKNNGAIVGAKEYFDATADGPEGGDFSTVGVRVYEEEGKSYFEVTYVTALTPYYAMYYIASSLYMPIPQEFLDLVTIKNYLGFNEDSSESPVDNSLSCGAYTLEQWDSDQQVVYKKNPYYAYADTKYAIAGIHINILPGGNEDPNLGIKEFLAGHTDSTGIPMDYLDDYKSDPRTRQTKGDSNFKLNVNATDSKTWEQLFGENGSVCLTDKADYWEVEPALSNPHFVRALSYSIDRLSFAAARGCVPSVDYLSSNYMSDGENGISYSGTAQHAKAVERLLEDTEYGYNLTLARDLFNVAILELEASGAYKRGTPENPTVIHLQIAWQRESQREIYHKEIAQYFETAFNHESVAGGCYKLETEFWTGDVWSDVYYAKMMVGQFDIGFGSISGNSLDPLGFLNVLSSDQDISGNFTLNWGTDTNDPFADILVYNGMRWSYDALYLAANGTAKVVKGANQPAFRYSLPRYSYDEATEVITINFSVEVAPDCAMEDIDIVFYGYASDARTSYNEYALSEAQDEKTGFTVDRSEEGVIKVTVTIGPGDYGWAVSEEAYSAPGIDLYAALTEFGNESPFDYIKSFDLLG